MMMMMMIIINWNLKYYESNRNKIAKTFRGATVIHITCMIRCKAFVRGLSELQPSLSE